MTRYGYALLALVVSAMPLRAEPQLPPEVTPAIRSACESDVRRLCVGKNPTRAGVKACVMRKFGSLNSTCQYRLITAGLVGKKKKKTAVAKSKKTAKEQKPAPVSNSIHGNIAADTNSNAFDAD